MSWLHPILGAVAALLVVWVALQGFRGTHGVSYSRAARAAHRRFAPWIYGFVAALAVAGTASVWALRDDLKPAESVHFWVLWGVTGLMTGGAVTSRSMRAPLSRRLHPIFGVGAVLGVLVGAALGLGMLPD